MSPEAQGWTKALSDKAQKVINQLVHDGAEPASVTTIRESHLPLAAIVILVKGVPKMRVSLEVRKDKGDYLARLVVEDWHVHQ